MTIQELEGEYSIIGTNQNAEGNKYKGILNLSIDEYNRVKAKWLINNWQEQVGYGFFNDNILVINFKYNGDENKVFKGVVVYKCLSKDILEGFWSEKHGNPNYLGQERCFRIENKKEHIN
ncbi:hypothetical protein [Seonamhaeicola maritimus]|uniref:hypothetical protein n=1 Tax=Seonamhaeicola maritimus TaxID=2591822 RepID=UPI002494A73F|nr:hypothetical protein [Seonamhaeicola maritimus]